jgi:hypothetical protein
VDLREFKGDGFDFLASTDVWLGAGECRTFGLTALVGISGLAPLRCTDVFSFGLNTFFENSIFFSKVINANALGKGFPVCTHVSSSIGMRKIKFRRKLFYIM